MEGGLFNVMKFFDNVDKVDKVDNLNDETFGFNDDYCEWNDDWEKQHKKLVEVENKRLSSSRRNDFTSKDSSLRDLNGSDTSPFNRKNKKTYIDSSDEDDIIESSISQLGLDDDYQFMVKPNRSPNIEFKEVKQSWTSPTRTQDHHQSDSLKELISPGEGVWASPTREQLLGSHHHPIQDMAEKKYEMGDIAKKLIYGHDFENNDMPVPTTPPIHVEDLERELINQNKVKKWTQPTIIEKHNTSTPLPLSNMIRPPKPNIPTPPGMPPFPPLNPRLLPPGLNQPPPFDMNMMASLLMYQQHMKIQSQQLMHGMIPPLLPFHLADPMLFGNLNQNTHQQHNYRKKHNDWSNKSPRYNNKYDSHRKDHQYEQQRYWQKEMRHPNSSDIDYEQFIQMGPSKLMNDKEKKWIFKISLMSLLSGDPNTSDYYFISLVNKNYLSGANGVGNPENKGTGLDKTNQLVNYAQQQQQTKESHKPVKFKGSLGKLSITSVHHPRQIMDFSSEPEVKVQETGMNKFRLYGMVEKMYTILLTIIDMERELVDAKEPEKTLGDRLEKINELFEFFKIELHSSPNFSDTIHFGNLMSISKARKLLTRVLLLFNQEQSESLFVSVINVLPALLRRDKEQDMLQFVDKVQIMLSRSTNNLKLKCVKLMRKIDLKVILNYPTSILMLATILDSLEEKDAAISLEWSYYVEEVPKVLLNISEDIMLKNAIQLGHLKSVLGINTTASISSIIEE